MEDGLSKTIKSFSPKIYRKEILAVLMLLQAIVFFSIKTAALGFSA